MCTTVEFLWLSALNLRWFGAEGDGFEVKL